MGVGENPRLASLYPPPPSKVPVLDAGTLFAEKNGEAHTASEFLIKGYVNDVKLLQASIGNPDPYSTVDRSPSQIPEIAMGSVFG